MRIHIGTSGYNYPEWRGTFYPDTLPAKQMFPYYAERFHTVEINYTFYKMPTEKTTTAWRDQAPPGFCYTLKAPKSISHIKRLQNAEDALAFFCNSARAGSAPCGAAVPAAAEFQVRPCTAREIPLHHAG